MPKTISAALRNHLGQWDTSLIWCWQIQRKDELVMAFVADTENFTIDAGNGLGAQLHVAADAVERTAIEQAAGLAVDNLQVMGAITSDRISAAEIRAGSYSGARVWSFAANRNDSGAGVIKLVTGFIGQITMRDDVFVAEFRSLRLWLQNEIVDVITPEADEKLVALGQDKGHGWLLPGLDEYLAYPDAVIAGPNEGGAL